MSNLTWKAVKEATAVKYDRDDLDRVARTQAIIKSLKKGRNNG